MGDLTVPKRMKAFGEAFDGRAAAYDLALNAGEGPLARRAVQEYIEWRGHRKRTKASPLCQSGRRLPDRTARGGVIGWIVEIPVADGSRRAAADRT